MWGSSRGASEGRYRARVPGSAGTPAQQDVRPEGRRRSGSCWRWSPTRPEEGGSTPEARRCRSPIWAEEFMLLCRRLAPTTQDTYRRDLDRYVLPRFGAYRLARIPADEIENWLNDEIAAGLAPSSVHRHYRVLRRLLQVAVDKQKLMANPCARVEPPRVPKREMAFLSWEEAVALAEAHGERYRSLIYLAVDSGMRWSELIGLRRSRLDLRTRKVRVTEQLVRLESGEWLRKEPKTPSGVRSITISPSDGRAPCGSSRGVRRVGPGWARVPERRGQPDRVGELLEQPLHAGAGADGAAMPLPRPPPHQRGARHRLGRAPEGHPVSDGPLVDQRHARPLRPPLPGARRGHRRLVRRAPAAARTARRSTVVHAAFGS